MELSPGSHVGRIRIDALIGAGGMGAVYRGFDERLERTVAVKVVHAGERISAYARARFLREARVLSKLDAPGICRIYDVVERDDGDCLVLELIEGQTLRELLPSLSRGEALRIALAIARVLTQAHDRGIVHRDLKPENVMRTPAGEVKVLDFGLARAISSEADELSLSDAPPEGVPDTEKTVLIGDDDATRTTAGSVVGTLHYMSPEQARGRALTDASDIYSLGILLIEMLQRGNGGAYGDAVGLALLERVRSAGRAPFDSGDRAVNAVVDRMTLPNPGDRPRAADVVRALESIVDRPRRRRQRLFVAGLAAACALVLAGAALLGERYFSNRLLFAGRRAGRVAILPFRNATNEPSMQWVELGMMDLVAQTLAQTRGLQVVPPEDVIRSMKNLGLARGASLSDGQRDKLFAALDADALIDAAVYGHDGAFVIRYAPLMKDRAESPREVSGAAITDAANELTRRLARRLDVAAKPLDVRDRYSSDDFANVAYAIGLQEMNTTGPAVGAHYFAVCLDRDPEFLWAKMLLADCKRRTGATEESIRLLDETLAQSAKKSDRALHAAVLTRIAAGAYDRGDTATTERNAQAALALERTLGNHTAIVANLNLLGLSALTRNDLDLAEPRLNEAWKEALLARNPRFQARVMNNLGLMAESRGDQRAAAARCRKALETATTIGDKALQATVVGNLSRYAIQSSDMKLADSYARRNVAIASEIEDHHVLGIALTNLASVLYNEGQDVDALAAAARGVTIGREMKDPRVEAVNLAYIAVLHTKRGELAEAEAPLATARKIAAGADDPRVRNITDIAQAFLSARASRFAESAAALDDAEHLAMSTDVLVGRARIAYEQGDFARASALMTQARARHESWMGYEQNLNDAVSASLAAGRKVPLAWELPVHQVAHQ
jgi:tetratricopeptide (TPR) repeat protein